MIVLVRALSEHPDTQMIVRHTEGLADGNAGEGVEIPKGAELVEIAFTRSATPKQQTVHIVFEPAWPASRKSNP